MKFAIYVFFFWGGGVCSSNLCKETTCRYWIFHSFIQSLLEQIFGVLFQLHHNDFIENFLQFINHHSPSHSALHSQGYLQFCK
jgi:hypothetical protein